MGKRVACEICRALPARMIILRRRGDDETRTLVCDQCAGDRARLYAGANVDFGGIVARFERSSHGPCELCGMTSAAIAAGDPPGCCLCYVRFQDALEETIRTVQGRTRHVGKALGDSHSERSEESAFLTHDQKQIPRVARNDYPVEWIAGTGPDSDVAVSTRARLARGLAGLPFPARASEKDLKAVARQVRTASRGLMDRFPSIRSFRVERLGPVERSFLLDARVASVEQMRGGQGRIVIAEPSGALSIMVNEEDHLRLQAMRSGLAPREVWQLVDWADDVLAAGLDHGYSSEYGYLTASVSNVGTGLRVSVMMHLAGLATAGGLGERLRAAHDLGVSVRGAFGEGSRAAGDMFQVSNEVTLGLTESEIVGKVRAVAEYLLGEERRARKELVEVDNKRLMEAASRAVRTLQSSMSLKAGEALTLISRLRLAAALGLVEGCPLSLANELLVSVQAGAGDDGVASINRAAVLRGKVAGVRVVSS